MPINKSGLEISLVFTSNTLQSGQVFNNGYDISFFRVNTMKTRPCSLDSASCKIRGSIDLCTKNDLMQLQTTDNLKASRFFRTSSLVRA